MIYYAIHAAAKNDASGNPRRCFLIYDSAGNAVGAVDEGYKGDRAVASSGILPDGATLIMLGTIPTTPSFRRECLRDFAPSSRKASR